MLIYLTDSEFVVLSDCACPGHNQRFKCRVFGEGATIWKGTAFECAGTDNEIVLLHAQSSSQMSPLQCNSGAIQGHIIRAVNNTYTSELSVAVSNELEGRSISCIHDSISGDGSINVIGSTLLSITMGCYY